MLITKIKQKTLDGCGGGCGLAAGGRRRGDSGEAFWALGEKALGSEGEGGGGCPAWLRHRLCGEEEEQLERGAAMPTAWAWVASSREAGPG